jgi:uracil phosphoribosyltransferase
MSVTILDHPLARHLLSRLRDRHTSPENFRRHSRTLSTLLILEATRGVATAAAPIETPLEPGIFDVLGQGLAIAPVLRAGLAMLESALDLFPDVAVGYIGLERSHETAVAHSYYCKLPRLTGRYTLCCDPMLATGGSASQAVSLLKAHGAERIAMVSVIAAPEGVARFEADHPDVPIITAGLDRQLDSRKYILPGLGDFGDRLYGTL